MQVGKSGIVKEVGKSGGLRIAREERGGSQVQGLLS